MSNTGLLFDPEDYIIPEFNEHGVLPEGIYECEERDFHKKFVESFPGSPTRHSIYDGFCRLRKTIGTLSLIGWHWIDGSYVTKKLDPVDLDLVTFADGEQLDSLSDDEQTLVLECLWGESKTKDMFSCDTHFIMMRPEDDPEYDVYQRRKQHFSEIFGRTNPKKVGYIVPKGFIRMPILHINDCDFDYSSGEISVNNLNIEDNQQIDRLDLTDLQDQLSSTVRLRQDLQERGINRFSTRLEIESLKKQEEWLNHKISVEHFLLSKNDGEIVLNGSVVKEHRIQAGFLAKFLAHVQNLVEGLTIGAAPYQMEIIPARGSFKISFVLTDLEQQSLPNLNDGSISGVDVLARIVSNAANPTDIINALKTREVEREYTRLMKIIDQKSVTMEMRTRRYPEGVVVTPDKARGRTEWLNEVEITTETVEVTGELRGGSLNTGRFEIASADGNTYSGRTSKQFARKIGGLRLGSVVSARLEKVTTNHVELDTPVISYALREISEIIEPALEL